MQEPKDSNHAELVQEFKQYWQGKTDDSKKILSELEVPYNHYGERGFIDLKIEEFQNNELERCMLFELKTSLQDIGETTRQFKRMREYFPESENIDHNKTKAHLIILDNSDNREVIEKNRDYFGDYTYLFNLKNHETNTLSDLEQKTPKDNKNEDKTIKLESDLTYQDIIDTWEREKGERLPTALPEKYYERLESHIKELKEVKHDLKDENTRRSRRITKHHQKGKRIAELFFKERYKKLVLAAYHQFLGKTTSTVNLTDEEIQLLEELTQALENGPKEKI